MKNKLSLDKLSLKDEVKVQLPASKSIHNRVVIISQLAGGKTRILNPSNARDSELMNRLIAESGKTVDARDAGTTFRFLTAYFAIQGEERIITGTPRMKERPIKLLVEALRKLGAEIEYLGEAGYPPLKLKGFQTRSSRVRIPGNVSSQYISALLMIGPNLPHGLEVEIAGEIGSRPYIEMTLSIMVAFGAKYEWKGQTIIVEPIPYTAPESFWVEPDWSAASYWYSFQALAGQGSIFLPGLKERSIQGDSRIADIMKHAGVNTSYRSNGVVLSQGDPTSHIQEDFTDCPDLAQTVAVTCAALGIKCYMRGLESLRIKETDRIAALQKELSSFGCTLVEDEAGWRVEGKFKAQRDPVLIKTYEDHRMAMAFAPLALLTPIEIEDPEVTRKSYPHFWDDLNKATSDS